MYKLGLDFYKVGCTDASVSQAENALPRRVSGLYAWLIKPW